MWHTEACDIGIEQVLHNVNSRTIWHDQWDSEIGNTLAWAGENAYVMPCSIAGAVYQCLVAALHCPIPLHKFLCVVLDCLKCTLHVSGALTLSPLFSCALKTGLA